MSFSLFVDESGNTGSDIYELEQPVFVYAGIWLTPEQELTAAQTLDQFYVSRKLQRPKNQEAELKGRKILNSRSGRQVVSDILLWLKEQTITIMVMAMEKLSMAANVIVEDCTDHAYNDAYDENWLFNTRLKEPLGELIGQHAPRDLLQAAWRARGGLDKDDFEKAYESLLFALTLSTNEALAREARRMSKVDLNEIWDTTANTRGTNLGYSPNLVTFAALVMNAEKQAQAMGYQAITVVHDEQLRFQDALTQTWTTIRGDGVNQTQQMLPNKSEIVWGLKNLTDLRFETAQTKSVGLQLADFVASAVRVALEENMLAAPDRSKAYLAALQELMKAGTHHSLFVNGSESWQLSSMKILLGNNRLRLPG